jgi:hypothetical protein
MGSFHYDVMSKGVLGRPLGTQPRGERLDRGETSGVMIRARALVEKAEIVKASFRRFRVGTSAQWPPSPVRLNSIRS